MEILSARTTGTCVVVRRAMGQLTQVGLRTHHVGIAIPEVPDLKTAQPVMVGTTLRRRVTSADQR